MSGPRRTKPRRRGGETRRQKGPSGGELSLLGLSRVMSALRRHEVALVAALQDAVVPPGDGGRWPVRHLADARDARRAAVDAAVEFGPLASADGADTVGGLEALYRLVAVSLPRQVAAQVDPLPSAAWGADTLLDDCVLRVRQRAIGWWLLGAEMDAPGRFARVIEAFYPQMPPDAWTGCPALVWRDAAEAEVD